MGRVSKFTLTILAVIALGYCGIHQGLLPGSAELASQKILAQANAVKDRENIDWISISSDGQRITIAGAAPTIAARDDAIKKLKSSAGIGGFLFGGVTSLNLDDLVVAQSSPDKDIWAISFVDDTLNLTGLMPDEKALDQVSNSA